MAEVTIYTTRICPYCIQAKMLLQQKSVNFHEIPVDNNPALRQEMMQKSGQRTVPQIWIGERHVGGFTDLWQLEQRDQLDALLAE